MSKQKISYDLDLVIGGNLTEIEQKLRGLKNGLSSILDSKDAPKGLTRQFEQISAMMDRIRDKTSSPITSASGFKSLGKDIEKLELSFNGLVREINKIDDLPDEVKIQIFPPEEQKRLSTAIESLKTYEQSLENINKKKKELDTAQRAQAKASKEKTSADRNVSYTKERIATKSGKKKELEAKLIGVSDKDSERAASYRAQIANLEQELTDLNSRLKEQEQIQQNANQAYEQASTRVSQLQGGLDGLQGNSLKELRDKAKELGISFRKTKDETPEQAMARLAEKIRAVLAGGLEKIPAELNDLTVEARETQTEVRKMGDAVGAAGDEFDNMSKTASAGDAFAGRIKQMLGIQGAARLMRAALRDAIQTITELDKTMTEMAVVTDLGVGDYWDQLPEYSKRATDLGVSINSAYEAATLFYQQGLKTNEVVEISTETLKMARIAGLGAEDATNKMTAALRGFNMELNETSAQKISDVYSQLAAITASDVNEISTAMTKTASIASSAGMEFETTAAFLSQIIETTRESAETAGTAMKTVIARFQELKKAPSEIGEVEGEIVDANKIEGALRTVGVALRDASGQFRNLDDVFLELASKWDGLDKNTQRYIATIAAGSRQQSRFIAMMSNYSRTQELVDEANNSAGASNKQFEKTLESLEAKMEQLKNAWHEFTMGIMNSDFVKGGIDLATKFLNVINNITSGVGGVGDSFTKLISIVAMFKLGIAVFEMIRPKIVAFLASVAQEFKAYGQQAGQNWAEGTGEGVQGANTQNPQAPKTRKEAEAALKQAQNNVAVAQQNLDKAKQKTQKMSGYSDNYNIKKKAIKDQAKAEEDLKKKQEALHQAEDNYAKTAPKRWQTVTKHMNGAGMALMGISATMNLVSQALADAGLDGAAETFQKLSQWIMIGGSALMAVGTAMNIIIPLIKKTGNEGAKAGIKASAAWGPWLIIFLAIAAIAAVIIGLLVVISKNSPEAKLKEATKAADEAAEAANNAKEAYDKLGDSLDSLGDKYKNLEDLRKGTEEWNKAVREINDSVLDLIQEYPELASLVTKENGVLTIDVESDEAKAILDEYEKKEILASGAELGAKLQVQKAKDAVAFSDLEAIDRVANARGWETAGNWTKTGMGIGAGAGAISGAVVGGVAGSIAGPVGSAILAPFAGAVGSVLGTVVGGLVGSIGGAIAGPIEAAATKNDKKLQEATEKLALDINNQDLSMEKDAIAKRLETYGVDQSEAEIMAEAFMEDTDALVDFGQAISASNIQQEAYYQAMATNAQAMIDLGKYNEEQLAQMSNVVDQDLMETFQEQEAARFQKMADEDGSGDDGEFDKAKKEYVESIYGENYRVDGNKILDEAGEVVREFADSEAWVKEMSAAEATERAAKMMEAVPDIIAKGIAHLTGNTAGNNEIFERAMKGGENLSKADLEVYNQMISNQQAVDDLWKNLDKKTKKALGWEESDPNSEASKKAFEEYKAILTEPAEKAKELYSKAEENAQALGITLNDSMSSGALHGWTNKLMDVRTASTQADMVDLNNQLALLLKNATTEEEDAFMSHLNSMDIMDKNAWDDLEYAAKELEISLDPTILENFAEAGKKASSAIEKIDFANFAEKISNTFKLLEKVEAGGRTYDKDDYKELVSDNPHLKEDFVKIGEEYHYIGGTMEELIEALQENTVSNLNEANEQLATKIAMGEAIEEVKKQDGIGNPKDMSEAELRYFIGEAREAASANGDVGVLEIPGFDNSTNISEITDVAKLREIATAMYTIDLASLRGDFTDGMHAANIETYTHNASLFNAEEAASNSEFAKQHQKALLLQATRSGGVSNELIEKYQAAIDGGNKDEILKVGKELSASIDEMVKENEKRSAYLDLVEQTKEAIITLREKTIDKLNDVNDSINSANEKLVSKIQEQIDADRQARENAEAEKQITDMRSQMAYLGADTSGMNDLTMLDKQKELEQAEQDLKDARIDQALENLQDANEKAAQQREDQINLLQQQLETDKELGIITEQATQIVEESLDKVNNGVKSSATEMGKIIALASSWDTMSDTERENAKKQLQGDSAKAADFLSKRGTRPQNVSGNQNTNSGAGNSNPVKNDQVKPSSGAQQPHGNSTYVPYKATINGDTPVEWVPWHGDVKQANVTAGNATGTLYFYTPGYTTIGANAQAAGIRDKEIFAYNNWHYLLEGGVAYKLDPNGANWHDTIEPNLVPYATGGLADFTGPAWLDGTKSKPEMVLNQEDTANFIVLKDVLSEILDGTGSLSQKEGQNGDNYFNIDISVEKLEDDYDVEQLADKIRRMIYDDATYRNVNTINLIR